MSGLVGASMRFWSDRLPYDYFGNDHHIHTSQFPDHLRKDQYDFQHSEFGQANLFGDKFIFPA